MTHPKKFIVSCCSIALFILAGISTASAQLVSIYGTFSPIRISNVVTGNTTGLNSTYTTGGFWAYGIGGGATFTPVHLGPISLGLDLRASTARQRQGADTILVGIKAGAKLPVLPFKPYLEAAGGYAGARTTITSGPFPIAGSSPNRGFWAYEILGGVDYGLLPHIDLRLVEIGGGQGYERGSLGGGPNLSFMTLSTGVVAHF